MQPTRPDEVDHAMKDDYHTIRYETSADQVATITLDRPEALNAFNRQMCEEIRRVWATIKEDPDVHAVVLRAAGDRAFSVGLDVKTPFGQPDDIWNHVDPGELLSPKWQKVWKPVVCAVQGMCTAGAFYFVNEADIVICSEDATFFDSHVTGGMVSALEPVGMMRRIGLGDTLRIALMGNDETSFGRNGIAYRPGDRDCGSFGAVGAGTRTGRPHGREAILSDPGHRARHLGIPRPSVPSGDGAGAHLHATGQSHWYG